VEQCLRAHSAGAIPAARLGVVAFIHRFSSALNPHLQFPGVVLDRVFASNDGGPKPDERKPEGEEGGGTGSDTEASTRGKAPGVPWKGKA